MTTIQKISKYLEKGSYAKKHADQIVEILKCVTTNQMIIDAGYLHDVLEDTDVTLAELEELVGFGVAHIVWEVTKTGQSELKNLHTKEAFIVKFADRLSNISNLPFKQYVTLGNTAYLEKSIFWKR